MTRKEKKKSLGPDEAPNPELWLVDHLHQPFGTLRL